MGTGEERLKGFSAADVAARFDIAERTLTSGEREALAAAVVEATKKAESVTQFVDMALKALSIAVKVL